MGISLLEKHVTSVLDELVGRQLTAYFFYESEPDYLSISHGEIDIVGFQIELVFDAIESVFISWDTVKGWHQYTVGLSKKSFFPFAQKFRPNELIWQRYIGIVLTHYEVYGYLEHIITVTQSYGLKTFDTYHNEPHMLVLHFNDSVLGVANFYAEKDFIPRLPMGDDVWVMYTESAIRLCIEKLGLEKLEA